MKNGKKALLSLGMLLGVSALSFAQDSYLNTLKIGANAGVGLDKTSNAAASFDMSYQYLVTPNFGLGISTGYSQYFGSELTENNLKTKYGNFGVVPVAALLRYYHNKSGMFLGTDVGISVPTSDYTMSVNNVNYTIKDVKGGLYIKPVIGYHNKNWNIDMHYQHVGLSNDLNKSNIGLGFSYNIPLGSK